MGVFVKTQNPTRVNVIPIIRCGHLLLVVGLLCIDLLSQAQTTKQERILVITGHPGELTTVELRGHTYVEISALAKLMNGSVGYRQNQIVLTLSQNGAETGPPATGANEPELSKGFLNAAIEQLTLVREWRATLVSAIQRSYPITDDWMNGFRDRAQKALAFVSVAISTDADRKTYDLLSNEYANMKTLSDQFVNANKSRSYVSPTSLDNDPLDQKIVSCGHSLAAVAASSKFVDDGSCH